jgi:hypothetical protein
LVTAAVWWKYAKLEPARRRRRCRIRWGDPGARGAAGQKVHAMSQRFRQNDSDKTEPDSAPQVRYILMGSIICAILVLIVLSVLATR